MHSSLLVLVEKAQQEKTGAREIFKCYYVGAIVQHFREPKSVREREKYISRS